MASAPASGRTSTLRVDGRSYRIVDLPALIGPELYRWPVTLRLLAENVARQSTGHDRESGLAALSAWMDQRTSTKEIDFLPGRLLMHDTTSTPALVDIAAMRSTIAEAGGDPSALNPLLPVEVSIDHSLAVQEFARPDALQLNIQHEIRRNRERYRFLKWAAASMDNVHINPPGTGIMHTINLEQLASVVTTQHIDDELWAAPDMMIGTDSHTPMINGLGVLGWGVGGLEAQSVMFGMPVRMRVPDVVGVRLTGSLPAGTLATDLALTVTHRLREIGVTGEFVEFFGPGVSSLTVGERAVVANMAPEYGATTGYFPVDERSLEYLEQTGRTQEQIDLVRCYLQRTGLWFDPEARPAYSRTLQIDLHQLRASAAGPRRPQDLVPLHEVGSILAQEPEPRREGSSTIPAFPVGIASITSCTNTTDPGLLIAAGLLARRARELGLTVPAWVKTSLAPGSPAARSYLERAGLLSDLEAVGFDIVGFGCATCIGNSGDLTPEIDQARRDTSASPVAVLSGNRNFPGRVHPDLDLGLLVSPPAVIAFALAGDAAIDLMSDVLQRSPDGRDVRLEDLWPPQSEVQDVLSCAIDPDDFAADFRAASQLRLWSEIEAPVNELFPWDEDSTILRRPPFAARDTGSQLGVYTAHPLLLLGDDITTDHISPASAIPRHSSVADFLVERGEDRNDLNVFASRRGNWEVMLRGGFLNRSVVNRLCPDAPVGQTVHGPSGEVMPLHEAAQRYRAEGRSVVVVAGDRYGMGSSRDWAAKVQQLLGIRAVLARGFERIHRSNLIGMGILPLLSSPELQTRLDALRPGDQVRVHAPADELRTRGDIEVEILPINGEAQRFTATAGIETDLEIRLLRRGGVLPEILAQTLGD